MDIIRAAEFFSSDHGNITFLHTRVLFRQNADIFLGHFPGRKSCFQKNEDIARLVALQQITLEMYAPQVVDQFTRVSRYQSEGVYVKRPNLLQFDGTVQLANFMVIDMQACERLHQSPHLNLARYLGCVEEHGRVTALCFPMYKETLMEKLNPNGLNKVDFVGTSAAMRLAASQMYLPRIEQAVRHMHDLGLVHNDINPSNIMIDSDDNPVLIDFDSCLPSGQPLSGIKRTIGWYDESIEMSIPENDWRALEEIKTWLEASTAQHFSFE